jgi:hypothetical protein
MADTDTELTDRKHIRTSKQRQASTMKQSKTKMKMKTKTKTKRFDVHYIEIIIFVVDQIVL